MPEHAVSADALSSSGVKLYDMPSLIGRVLASLFLPLDKKKKIGAETWQRAGCMVPWIVWCKCQFHLLVILCNQTSLSERLGHVIYRGSFRLRSNLGATRVFVDYVVISLVYGRRNSNWTDIVKDLTPKIKRIEHYEHLHVNQGYGNTNFRIVNHV